MPFPISISGSVAARDLTVDQAVDRLEVALAGVKAGALQRVGCAVHFRGGAFRLVSNWNILVPISTGVLEVRSQEDGVSVWYRASFSQLLLVVTLMVAAVFGPAVAMSAQLTVLGRVGVLLVLWSWLFGTNFVLTYWRLPRFLARSLVAAGK